MRARVERPGIETDLRVTSMVDQFCGFAQHPLDLSRTSARAFSHTQWAVFVPTFAAWPVAQSWPALPVTGSGTV